MLNPNTLKPLSQGYMDINKAYRINEQEYVPFLSKYADLSTKELQNVKKVATDLIVKVRQNKDSSMSIDSFLSQYSLSSEEGVALMCLAEALLRVPDEWTIDRLIKDKVKQGNWDAHRGKSPSFFVNATTWALMLTGKFISPEQAEYKLSQALLKLMNRGGGEKMVRIAVDKAMRIMSRQFVLGRTIKEGLKRAKSQEAKGYLYSYDMLGEAALTEADATRYLNAYRDSIDAIGKSETNDKPITAKAGISIKLSALYPKYHEMDREQALKNMAPRLLELAQLAKQYDIGLTVDAEESERLMLSLDIIERVYGDASLKGWDGFGLAVQSYQKRAFYILDWLANLAKNHGRRIMVRLIKGAYWDSEIKETQVLGLDDYPVFTRKVFTDVSFQACVKKILTMTEHLYPQFATHNAYSVATVLELVGDYRDFEFQCLHGMGAKLYEQIVDPDRWGIACRIYAPVGQHEDLLPYLVRRLLENGANSSFVNRIVDEKAPVASLVQDPVARALGLVTESNSYIPNPSEIFLPQRQNSRGLDLTDRQRMFELQTRYDEKKFGGWKASPLLDGKRDAKESSVTVYSPQCTKKSVGSVQEATEKDVETALSAAERAFKPWSQQSVHERAACIIRFASLLELHREELFAIACYEAGKTWPDAIAEVREAIDFCYYYANQAIDLLAEPCSFTGYTGESNVLRLDPRGTVLCISPWNFPLAIFAGQAIAALLTGNCVVAKPAEQTPIMAAKAVSLMHEAGVPKGVMQLLPGRGESIGAKMVADPRVKAVVFTGSTQTARHINQSLANRSGPITPLIAETGGLNAMIADSSALLEQVTQDVLLSAFGSAGQRCSALRVLFLQDEIYDRAISMITGAMALLNVGDPQWMSTDVGPVIDEEARAGIKAHIAHWNKDGRVKYESPLSKDAKDGFYVPPTIIEIDSIKDLSQEIFGPVLHVVRYQVEKLDDVIDDINATGYGLTFGIHSRINHMVEYIRGRVHAGNCYVNRNTTGAIVGLQPFGGEGLSGTGPKAGGPWYLIRFCHERHCSVDTTAAGGNASLMSMPQE